jgi:hypothetical protein
VAAALFAFASLATPAPAAAQTPLPERDRGWGDVTHVTVAVAAATQLLLPRFFFADGDAELTYGPKARWHVSVLAPVLTLAGASVLSGTALPEAFKDPRPGCDATNQGSGPCSTYGMPSALAFAAFSALGHGTSVFLVDTLKHGGGRVDAVSLTGNVIVPAALAAVTDAGRAAGRFESGGQILAGSLSGLAVGLVVGFVYATMQRPECGYTGSLVCW